MIEKKGQMFAKRSFSVICSFLLLLTGVHQVAANNIVFDQNQLDQHELKGKIIDTNTGASIPFCSVMVENMSSGSSSNEEGNFVIKIDTLPARIIFSHLNYKKQIITVSETTEIVIKLTPLAHSLEEVVLESGGSDDYALDLARKAFKKMTALSTDKKYGKALYRQKAKNGNAYAEFSEIIYDIRYSANGIEDWEIIEGRYALKENSVNNKNFTLLSRLLKSFQPNTDELIFPLHTSLENYYSVKILDVLNTNEDKVIVVHFKPKQQFSKPVFEGEVYIHSSTYEVLKVVGSVTQDNVKLIRLTEKNTTKKNYKLSYEMAFKKDALRNLVIDYINVKQDFDYYKEEVLKTHVSSESQLFFFEYYTPVRTRKIGKQFSRRSSDWENLNEIGYNQKFWEENQIIKRTPAEQEVIEAFEKGKRFESIFLNSRQQIALIQSGISGDPVIKWLGKSMNTYARNNKFQKVYLHLNKELFSPGDMVWYSAYGVMGPFHNETLKSQVLYVDLISSENKFVKTQKLELVNGRAQGSLEIDRTIVPGIYKIRAYTNWMRNFDNAFFFHRTVEIVGRETTNEVPQKREDLIDLQFFPEGGDAIAGLLNKIAFKATGIDGLGRKVKGKVVNSKGESVAKINSIYSGIGSFRLIPKIGETYTAVLEDNSTYPLPEIKNQGYVMAVDNRNAKTVRVKIQTGERLKEDPIYLIGHIRGKKYYQSRLQFNGTDIIDFEIPKNRLPSGIMTLTLLDQYKKPLAERIVFIRNDDELIVNTKISKNRFNAKDKLVLDIHVTDVNGRPVSSEFSVAITDATNIEKSTEASNILTRLLLESELKGALENPGIHFKDQKASTRSRLDLLLLTQGWRRFNWDRLEEQKNDSIKEFSMQERYEVSGIARDVKNRVLANTTLNIIANTTDRFGFEMYTTRTDASGRFKVSELKYSDAVKLVFSAYTNTKEPIGVKVSLDNREEQVSLLPKPNYERFISAKTEPQVERDRMAVQTALRAKDNAVNSIEEDMKDAEKLDVVNIKGKVNPVKRAAVKSKYGIVPDATIYMEDHPAAISFINLLGQVSGVQVQGSGRNMSVQIRNLYSPLWVIDGIPMESERSQPLDGSDEGGEIGSQAFKTAMPVPEFIANLEPRQIERMEVLKGPSSAAYGIRGAGGVILVYTKTGQRNYTQAASSEFDINMYSEVKEFYVPKYDIDPQTRAKQDFRTTLYWNPLLKTDENGNASITFFSADNTQKIQIAVEGISNFGIPGAYLKTIGD